MSFSSSLMLYALRKGAKLLNVTSFMLVHLSARDNPAPNKRIFAKL